MKLKLRRYREKRGNRVRGVGDQGDQGEGGGMFGSLSLLIAHDKVVKVCGE